MSWRFIAAWAAVLLTLSGHPRAEGTADKTAVLKAITDVAEALKSEELLSDSDIRDKLAGLLKGLQEKCVSDVDKRKCTIEEIRTLLSNFKPPAATLSAKELEYVLGAFLDEEKSKKSGALVDLLAKGDAVELPTEEATQDVKILGDLASIIETKTPPSDKLTEAQAKEIVALLKPLLGSLSKLERRDLIENARASLDRVDVSDSLALNTSAAFRAELIEKVAKTTEAIVGVPSPDTLTKSDIDLLTSKATAPFDSLWKVVSLKPWGAARSGVEKLGALNLGKKPVDEQITRDMLVADLRKLASDVSGETTGIEIAGAWYGNIHRIQYALDHPQSRHPVFDDSGTLIGHRTEIVGPPASPKALFCDATPAVFARCSGEGTCMSGTVQQYYLTSCGNGTDNVTLACKKPFVEAGIVGDGASPCGYEPAPHALKAYTGLVVAYRCAAHDGPRWAAMRRQGPRSVLWREGLKLSTFSGGLPASFVIGCDDTVASPE